MNLLAILAAHAVGGSGPGDPGVLPNPPEVQPGTSTLTAPYNAPAPLFIPTPDGTGNAVHPDIWDAGTNKWGGWRYWMAVTPYYGGLVSLENPCVYVSDDLTNWQSPAGLVNPIDPTPAGGYNSDTDIAYDPAADALHVYYRETNDTTFDRIVARSSSNGSTWSTEVELFTTGFREALSPAVVRRGPGDWLMFTAGYTGTGFTSPVHAVRTATGPLGPWSGPTPLVASFPNSTGLWHLDVLWDAATSRFHMLACTREPFTLWAYVSADGTTWTRNSTAVMPGASGQWDGSIYRASATLADNGVDYDVVYSSGAPWQVGHTQIPRAHWADIV